LTLDVVIPAQVGLRRQDAEAKIGEMITRMASR
jgi:hypothetical protein